MPGTRFLTPEEALKRFEQKDTLDTLLGSGKVADEFNVANKVYKDPQPVEAYIDGSLSKEALAKERRWRQVTSSTGSRGAGHARSLVAAARGAAPRASGGLWAASFLVPLLALVRGQLRAVHLAPDGAGHGSGRRRPGSRRASSSTRAAFEAENAEAARPQRAPGRGGAPANPVFCRRRTRWLRALVTGFTTPPARPDEPWLHESLWHSITGDLLGLPDVVGHRRAARHPVRRAARDGPADRAVHRVLPLPAGARVRRAGRRGAGHRGRAQGRDHLHRHVLPAGAGHRQHDAPDRSRAARGGADAGRVAPRR